VAGFHAGRQMLGHPGPVHVCPHVRQHRPSCADPLRPFQDLRQVGMGVMMAEAQEAAHDPGVDALERGERVVVQPDDVGRIAEAANAQAQRSGSSVVLLEYAYVEPRDGMASPLTTSRATNTGR
jgi:hypothetical protein